MTMEEQERTVLAIWRDVLAAPAMNVDDDFFELGGHSLAAMKIASRVKRSLGFSIEPGIVFECPTVREMARRLG
jgi:acyl carrier protein